MRKLLLIVLVLIVVLPTVVSAQWYCYKGDCDNGAVLHQQDRLNRGISSIRFPNYWVEKENDDLRRDMEVQDHRITDCQVRMAHRLRLPVYCYSLMNNQGQQYPDFGQGGQFYPMQQQGPSGFMQQQLMQQQQYEPESYASGYRQEQQMFIPPQGGGMYGYGPSAENPMYVYSDGRYFQRQRGGVWHEVLRAAVPVALGGVAAWQLNQKGTWHKIFGGSAVAGAIYSIVKPMFSHPQAQQQVAYVPPQVEQPEPTPTSQPEPQGPPMEEKRAKNAFCSTNVKVVDTQGSFLGYLKPGEPGVYQVPLGAGLIGEIEFQGKWRQLASNGKGEVRLPDGTIEFYNPKDGGCD